MTLSEPLLYLGLVKILDSLKNIRHSNPDLTRTKSTIVTIGNFDGVHAGHRHLLTTLVQEARRRKKPSVVVTFDPHPVQILYPDKKLQKIFSRQDQERELEKLGIDILIVEAFTHELAKFSAEAFLNDWIYQNLKPELLIVGYDFSFGANRSGGIPQLLVFAKTSEFELMVIPPHKIQGSIASSSRVRQDVQTGNMESVQLFLERAFYVGGVVEKGDQRGRTIVIPTANLKTSAELLPAAGVYVSRTWVQQQAYPSITNIGVRPTFGEGQEKIETHIFDFNQEIYGQNIRIEFLKRLRPEKKFASIEDLKKQIKEDILIARAYFK